MLINRSWIFTESTDRHIWVTGFFKQFASDNSASQIRVLDSRQLHGWTELLEHLPSDVDV
jgi:hypothetical protein